MDIKKSIFDRFITKNKDRLALICLKKYSRRIKRTEDKNHVRACILTKLKNNLYAKRKPIRRFCSTQAIRKMDGRELISDLEKRLVRENKQLWEANKYVRWGIIYTLKELGTKNIEVFYNRLEDENEFWRTKNIAIHALRDFDDVRSIPKIVKIIDHSNQNIRCSAVLTLGELLILEKNIDEDFKIRILELLKALNDTVPAICWRAAEAIGKIGEKVLVVEDVTKELKKIIYSKASEKIRHRALLTLGEINAINLVEMIIEIIMNENESIIIRQRASSALAEIASKSSKKPLIKDEELIKLIKLLKNENIEFRVLIAWVLGELKNNMAIEPLRNALSENKNKEKMFWFAISLAKLEGIDGEGHQIIKKMIRQKKLVAKEKFRYYEFLLKYNGDYQKPIHVIRSSGSAKLVEKTPLIKNGFNISFFLLVLEIIFQTILEAISWPTVNNKNIQITLWVMFAATIISLLVFWIRKQIIS